MRRLLMVLALATMNMPVDATVVVPAGVEQLTRDADAVVLGRIAAVDAQLTDDRQSIERVVTVDAEAYLKGALGPSVRFRIAGGQLGRYRRIVIGAPEFAVGQRVIVFLGARGGDVLGLLGLGQGVFRVVRGSSGWVVTPPVLVGASGAIVRGNPLRRSASLEEFERSVRAFVARQ